ncbi:MAG: zf-HC2 domain-containing protein [Candidatus Omnitrophota bacterium]
MNRRICLSEEILSEYLAGVLPEEDRGWVEGHIAECTRCRKLLAESHEVLKKRDIEDIFRKIFNIVKNNLWFAGAMSALALSFVFPKYFLQFLVACLLMGAKWIMDTKNAKMLVMIYDAWKRERRCYHGKETDHQGREDAPSGRRRSDKGFL